MIGVALQLLGVRKRMPLADGEVMDDDEDTDLPHDDMDDDSDPVLDVHDLEDDLDAIILSGGKSTAPDYVEGIPKHHHHSMFHISLLACSEDGAVMPDAQRGRGM